MAVLSVKAPEMIPSMVAHLHTVLRLQQRSSHLLAWLEYDIQFRMELAASADRAWTCGDPWQYVACLPSQHLPNDPFEVSELAVSPVSKGKGKRPPDQEGEKGVPRPPQKKPKKGSAGCTTLQREDARMAGSAFFSIGARAVGQSTSMVAFPAKL